MRVYLAGAIFGKTDAQCKAWREEAKRLLAGHECLDPMDRDYRGQEGEMFDAIVIGDKNDVDSCEVLLAMADAPSWGTAMEILYAYERGKRVVAVVPSRCSPWLWYHADIYPTLGKACEAIR